LKQLLSAQVQSIPSMTKSAPLSPDVAPRDSASPHRVDNMIRRHAPQPDRMPPPGDMQTIVSLQKCIPRARGGAKHLAAARPRKRR